LKFSSRGSKATATSKRKTKGESQKNASGGPDTKSSGPKAALAAVLLTPNLTPQLADAGTVTLDADAQNLQTLAALLDDFDPNFAIVTP
jgi:alkyl sulfatase BDS1-like metallo-beta-lactamase superfamily hydrolase